jgi:hypothetical protein
MVTVRDANIAIMAPLKMSILIVVATIRYPEQSGVGTA